MVAYNFTKQRQKIFQLHAQGMFFRDIAKECKISATKAHMVVRRIEENVPKDVLDKIREKASRQNK
jgi:DNA-binding NarL/FixJ family response regulator